MAKTSIFIYFYLFLLFASFVSGGRIGKFKFHERELLHDNLSLEEKANELELVRKSEKGFIARVNISGGTLQAVAPEASLTKVESLLEHFSLPDDIGNLNGEYYLQLVVTQQSPEKIVHETSDYFLLGENDSVVESSLQKHVSVEDCISSEGREAIVFHISQYAADRSGGLGAVEEWGNADILEEECTNHTYKKRLEFRQYPTDPFVGKEFTRKEYCHANNYKGQENHRFVAATFTPNTVPITTVGITEEECKSGAADRRFVSFNATGVREFTEEYVKESECNSNADSIEPVYTFNTDATRWDKNSREDALEINGTESIALSAEQLSMLPYYVGESTNSVGSIDNIILESKETFARNTLTERETPSKEPSFTLTAWVKGSGDLLKIIGSDNQFGQKAVFHVDGSGKPTLDFNFPYEVYSSSLLTSISSWTHVGFVYDGFGSRYIVVNGEEELDTFHNTTYDYNEEQGILLAPFTHNVVRLRKNELGETIGKYSGFSPTDCYAAALGLSHVFFTVEEGECKSSNQKGASSSSLLFRMTTQYRISADSYASLSHGPFTGQIDEVMLFKGRLAKETIEQLGSSQNIGTRFDGSSLVLQASSTRGGRATKTLWNRYENFIEEQSTRAECQSRMDHRYELPLSTHPYYVYAAEGRGLATRLSYTPYKSYLENVSILTVPDSCTSYGLENRFIVHNRENSSYADCVARSNNQGVCKYPDGTLEESEESACTSGEFLPFTNFTFMPADYELEYNVKEEDCQQTEQIWGQSQPVLIGEQGANQHVFNDYELSFSFKNKIGGERLSLNVTSLHSMKEWCRNHISCVGIQEDSGNYFPIEYIQEPPTNRTGYRPCTSETGKPIQGGFECYMLAVDRFAPAGLVYVHGDEYRSFAWGYNGKINGEVCSEENGAIHWSNRLLIYVVEQTGTGELTMTQAQCEFYATENSLTFGTMSCSNEGATHPKGCYKKNNVVFFNDCPSAVSTTNCDEPMSEATIQKFSSGSGTGYHLSKSECQQRYSSLTFYDIIADGYGTGDSYPPGCSVDEYDWSEAYWNSDMSSTYSCSYAAECVRRVPVTTCIKNGGFRPIIGELCSSHVQEYFTLPIFQSRWQRNNDTVVNRKESQCVEHRLDWVPYDFASVTIGTSSKPHFTLKGEKSWQQEAVQCLYITNSTVQLNISTLRECRDTALYYKASGYSFKDGYEELYISPRHYAHIADAQQECDRLGGWELCTSAEFDCSVENQMCLNADSTDDMFYAPAACCRNSGRACYITTDTSTCEPTHSYDSFFFDYCGNEIIDEGKSNVTYNVYDPAYERSEFRTETQARVYDPSYYDIVSLGEGEHCRRGQHISYEECLQLRPTIPNHAWIGQIYDRHQIAGCAFVAGELYFNRYMYENAKLIEYNETQFCRRYFEHFETIFDYTNTSCLYLNHELEIQIGSILACQEYAIVHDFKAISYVMEEQRCWLARQRGPCEKSDKHLSRFLVLPSAIENFTRNTNTENTVQNFSDCIFNKTAFEDYQATSFGKQEYGVQFDIGNESSYGTLGEAKTACVEESCFFVYFTPTTSLYYLMQDAFAAIELTPTHSDYTEHKHWINNDGNYHARKHTRHKRIASKGTCLEECMQDTECAMAMFSNGFCFFYDEYFEIENTTAALNATVMYNQPREAVAYDRSQGACYLYRNRPGKKLTVDSEYGNCEEFVNNSNFTVYPLHEALRGERKVLYLLEEADTSMSDSYAEITTEERTKAWCDDREGTSSFTPYGVVEYKSREEGCSATWTRDPPSTRANILQRECELIDSKSISWQRDADILSTSTLGDLTYQRSYNNGYKKMLRHECGERGEGIQYSVENNTLYGEECYEEVVLNQTTCAERDVGFGYAIDSGKCYIYIDEIGSNRSDCRWRHGSTGNTYRPLRHKNLFEAIDACNQYDNCLGICEDSGNLEGTRSFYLSEKEPRSYDGQHRCYPGWSGDCYRRSSTLYLNKRITTKFSSKIAFCDSMGQVVCPLSNVSNASALCCGKLAFRGIARQENIFYKRVKELQTCRTDGIHTKSISPVPIRLVAHALLNNTEPFFDEDCEVTCLRNASCHFFSNNSNGECWLSTATSPSFRYPEEEEAGVTYRMIRKTGVHDTVRRFADDLIGDCTYQYGREDKALVAQNTSYETSSDTLYNRWECFRGRVNPQRNYSFSIHSFNDSFKFDIMKESYVTDKARVYEKLKDFNTSTHTSVVSLEDCLSVSSTDHLVTYSEISKECTEYYDNWEMLPLQSQYYGQSYFSEGVYEGPFHLSSIDLFPVEDSILSYRPEVAVEDWLLSTAKDSCTSLCDQLEACKLFILEGQDCFLYPLPNQTTIHYLRGLSNTQGQTMVFLRTEGDFTCRVNGSDWSMINYLRETSTVHPLNNTELLGTAPSLLHCKQMFLDDGRVPRLDTLLFSTTTGECRISLLRNSLVISEENKTIITQHGFEHYFLSSKKEGIYEEDIGREECLQYGAVVAGKHSASIATSPLFERYDDIIRHNVREADCNGFSWDKNRNNRYTYNVKEEVCQSMPNFVSWESTLEGVEKVVVQTEAECLAYSTDTTEARYLGNEELAGVNTASACNGYVDEHNYEKIMSKPVQMIGTESDRITLLVETIDACAIKAFTYYAGFNRSLSTKVFEFKFTSNGEDNCAYFKSLECLGLCLGDDDPPTNRQNFHTFRLDETLGLNSASCWLMSVFDKKEGSSYCRRCPIGKHNARSGQNCLPCPMGTFADEPGLSTCKLCAEGTFQFGSGSSHCHTCPSGEYQDEVGKRNCKICGAGKYSVVDNGCALCPAGRAASSNFEENSAAESLVYTGKQYRGPLLYFDSRYDYSGLHGISEKNQDTGEFLKGYSPMYSSLRAVQASKHDSIEDCISCEAGKYAPSLGTVECLDCAPGQYSDQEAQTECKLCAGGAVSRKETVAFHEFMPFACNSAETRGEHRETSEPYAKTFKDLGLLDEKQSIERIDVCLESCRNLEECLYASYNAVSLSCKLYRKCDEIDYTPNWSSFRRSSYSTSKKQSTALNYDGNLRVEATLYAPPHHECEEESIRIAPDTYVHKQNVRAEEAGTIAVAFTLQQATELCNSLEACVGYSHVGEKDNSRLFTENEPIYLKSQMGRFDQTGYQSYYKEEPIDTKQQCQEQCALKTNCSYIVWNTTKRCPKYSACTPRKKNTNALETETESNIYEIEQQASYTLFPFPGLYPCDAMVYSAVSLENCEEKASAIAAPLFYYEESEGALESSCHLYTQYTANGVDAIFSGELKTDVSVCMQGTTPAAFDFTGRGKVRVIGDRTWDSGSSTCNSCPAGLHTANTGSSICRQCAAGRYDEAISGFKPECQPCETGRYSDEAGQSNCKGCSSGRYQDQTTQKKCKQSGTGYRTSGLGFPFKTILKDISSGPFQNNTLDDRIDSNYQGATSRVACGRNAYAHGEENTFCLQVPMGSISVKKEINWLPEASNCRYEEEEEGVEKYMNISTTEVFYKGDMWNRNGLKSLQECVDYVRDMSDAHLYFVQSISYGEGYCHFFGENENAGVKAKCILNDNFQSVYLDIGEATYGSDEDAPAPDPEWFLGWNIYGTQLRHVSPYFCSGLHYNYMGDWFSPKECVNICRMQQALGHAACRYISFNPEDNRCYLVNWKEGLTLQADGSGLDTSGLIFENSLADVEEPCSFGSRTVSHNGQTGTGSGGYKMQEYVPNNPMGAFTEYDASDDDTYGDIMRIEGRKTNTGQPMLGNGGAGFVAGGGEEITIPHGSTSIHHELNQLRRLTMIKITVGKGIHKTLRQYRYASLKPNSPWHRDNHYSHYSGVNYQPKFENARYQVLFWPAVVTINGYQWNTYFDEDLLRFSVKSTGVNEKELQWGDSTLVSEIDIEFSDWQVYYVECESYPDIAGSSTYCKDNTGNFGSDNNNAHPVEADLGDIDMKTYYSTYEIESSGCWNTCNLEDKENLGPGTQPEEVKVEFTYMQMNSDDFGETEWTIDECDTVGKQTRLGVEWETLKEWNGVNVEGAFMSGYVDEGYLDIFGTGSGATLTVIPTPDGCGVHCATGYEFYQAVGPQHDNSYMCRCATQVNTKPDAFTSSGSSIQNGFIFSNIGSIGNPDLQIKRKKSGSELSAECRWARKRFYDRLTTALIQEHTLPTSSFPDYKSSNGYDGGPNKLSILGFYDLWDLNDITPSVYVNNNEYIYARGNRTSEKFSFLYKKMNHIAYNKTRVQPLYDVGTNVDTFYNFDRERAASRAVVAGNSFEFCKASSTSLRTILLPESCEDLGFPYVVDAALSTGSAYRICVKIAYEANPIQKQSGSACCVGRDCTGTPYPLCSQTADHTALELVLYEVAKYEIAGGVIAEITSIDFNEGMMQAKDLCNKFGDLCMAVSGNTQEELYYLHSYDANMTITGVVQTSMMKYPNFYLDQLGAKIAGGLATESKSIIDCARDCRRQKHCLLFVFDTTNRACVIQDNFGTVREATTEETSIYRLRTSEASEDSKSQYCFNCQVGTTSTSAYQGGVGSCHHCDKGEISSASESINVADSISGEAAAETCVQCPQGMYQDPVTESCRACERGMACPHKASMVGEGVTICPKHQYSTSSLLDFVGQDISSSASLRCEVCSAGKYNSDLQSSFCEICPKGFTSKPGQPCIPCRRGTYSLFAGADECIAVDSDSYVSWPASTLAHKRVCSDPGICWSIQTQDQYGGTTTITTKRLCTAKDDAQCVAEHCMERNPGQMTFMDSDGQCQQVDCPKGYFSETGCLGTGVSGQSYDEATCCRKCSSKCAAGFHSTGCGGPEDIGGSTSDTGCSACPINKFLEFSAIGNECPSIDDSLAIGIGIGIYTGPYTNTYAIEGKCSKCDSFPHTIDEESKIKDHFCAVGTGTEMNEGYSGVEASTTCCSASSYSCVPCRAGSTGDEGFYTIEYNNVNYEFGKRNQPIWTTNGQSGQRGCVHWKKEWGNEAEKEYEKILARKWADEALENAPATNQDSASTNACRNAMRRAGNDVGCS